MERKTIEGRLNNDVLAIKVFPKFITEKKSLK